MDIQRPLCKKCKALNLTPEDFVYGPTDKTYSGSHRLGTFFGIFVKAHVCPLCRLIFKSLSEQPYAKLSSVIHGPDTGHALSDMNAICFATWQVDGRLPHKKTNAYSTSTSTHMTRRLCIEWNYEWNDKCFERYYLIMVARHPTRADSNFLGRHLGSTRETHLQLIDR